jgi:RNA polymerase sigma factor (TIGR02999 family)
MHATPIFHAARTLTPDCDRQLGGRGRLGTLSLLVEPLMEHLVLGFCRAGLPGGGLGRLPPGLGWGSADQEAIVDSRQPTGDLTLLLHRACAGDREAGEIIAPLILDELERLAHAQLRDQRRDHTLQTLALVNEAWLKLVTGKDRTVNDRNHFFALAATAMRTILVDYARRRRTAKRSTEGRRELLDELVLAYEKHADLVDLDDALRELALEEPALVRLVELRFILGLTVDEVAKATGQTLRTTERDLQFVRSWLTERLGKAT